MFPVKFVEIIEDIPDEVQSAPDAKTEVGRDLVLWRI